MGNKDVENIYRNLPLPHFIWVTEFGLLDEYPNFVRGEIIWDATRNGHELVGWIALHAPEYLIIDIGSAFNGPQKIDKRALKDSGKYPLFVSNLSK